MVIGSLTLQLYIPASHSLKEKRSVVKSVVSRLRNEFNVSVAEIAEQDRWQTAIIGVACVSGDGNHVRQQLQAVADWVHQNRPDVDVTLSDIELW
jgi:uncharacterized protein